MPEAYTCTYFDLELVISPKEKESLKQLGHMKLYPWAKAEAHADRVAQDNIKKVLK